MSTSETLKRYILSHMDDLVSNENPNTQLIESFYIRIAKWEILISQTKVEMLVTNDVCDDFISFHDVTETEAAELFGICHDAAHLTPFYEFLRENEE